MPVPVHPGRIVRRELKARKISGRRLALDLVVPADRIGQILGGKRAITADTACAGRVMTATSPEQIKLLRGPDAGGRSLWPGN